MKRFITKIGIILLALIIGLSPLMANLPVYALDTLYESCTSTTLDGNVDGSNGQGQGFTPSVTHLITSVGIRGTNYNTYTGTITVNIYLNGDCTGTILASGTRSATNFAAYNTYTEVNIPLTAPTILTAAHQYSIGVIGSTTGSGKIMPNRSGTNVYAGGILYNTSNHGSTWSAVSTADAWFKEYGTTEPAVTTTAATAVTATTATLNGTLDTLGIEAHGHVFFGYRKDGGVVYEYYAPYVYKDTLGAYSANIAGLSHSTLYHFCAFVYDAAEANVYQGVELDFTTGPGTATTAGTPSGILGQSLLPLAFIVILILTGFSLPFDARLRWLMVLLLVYTSGATLLGVLQEVVNKLP